MDEYGTGRNRPLISYKYTKDGTHESRMKRSSGIMVTWQLNRQARVSRALTLSSIYVATALSSLDDRPRTGGLVSTPQPRRPQQTKERLLYPRTITNRTTIMCDRAIDT